MAPDPELSSTLIPEKLLMHKVCQNMNIQNELKQIFQTTFQFTSLH